MNEENILILNDIRSVHNVGSIFRTADAVAISKIYLVGTTPTPVDRFGRKRNDLAKVALGAEENIEWEYFEDIKSLIQKLKEDGFYIMALEQSRESVSLKDVKTKEKNCLVVGNEVDGLSESILNSSDLIVEIPMYGKKESLNVSVATGIALYQILNT